MARREMIRYPANGGMASGFLARPDGDGNGNGMGIIVIQEWWGLVPHIKEIAGRFAIMGYHALAPDLWDGKRTTNPDEAGRLYMALNIDDAAAKMRGAADALHALGVSGKIGIIGYCMGGILAVYAAGAQPDLFAAVVDYYGGHPHVKPAFDKIKAPVLLVAGEKDSSVPVDLVRGFKEKIEAGGGRAQLLTYPAGHAFFNDARPEAYDAPSAADVWEKTKAFLAANLR